MVNSSIVPHNDITKRSDDMEDGISKIIHWIMIQFCRQIELLLTTGSKVPLLIRSRQDPG